MNHIYEQAHMWTERIQLDCNLNAKKRVDLNQQKYQHSLDQGEFSSDLKNWKTTGDIPDCGLDQG